MRKSRAASWWYIYSQACEAVAHAMIAEGKIRMLPHSALRGPADENGHLPAFSVIVPREMTAEFDRRVRELQS